MKRLCQLGVVTFLWLGSLSTPTEAVSTGEIDDLLRLLREQGIAPTNACRDQALIEAVVRVYDPYAVIEATDTSSQADTNQPPAVVERAEMWHSNMGYVKLSGMRPGATESLRRQFESWSTSSWCGVILDLRDTGGGNLEAAEGIASLLCPASEVLYSVFDCNRKKIDTRRRRQIEPLEAALPPAAVLVNEETSGASEILSAALKGKRDIVLVGQSTKGDLGLRRRIPLDGSNVLRVATRWVGTADGTPCHPNGVQPDLVVDTTHAPTPTFPSLIELRNPLSANARGHHELDRRVGRDAVLRQAVDLLLGLKALRGECSIQPIEVPPIEESIELPVPEVESPDAGNPLSP